jgi:rod shape-determining protein MreB
MSELKILHVGIDFGTSKSVIACDNGLRICVPSYVGFPKDTISKKMLGKDVLFGEEALKHRLALDLYRPLDVGVLKYSNDPEQNPAEYRQTLDVARRLLAHLIDLVTDGKPEEYSIRGVIGTPALATQKNNQALIEIADGLLDSVLIASEPFAVAFGLNLLNNTLVIDIGAGTTDLCRMHGSFPTEADQITANKAGDHIDQVLFRLIANKYPEANFTVNMVKNFKEYNAVISSNDEKLLISLPIKGKPTELDVTDELKQACRSIVVEIVAGIDHLVSTYDPEFQDELKENIILAGGGSQIIGLREEIERHMNENLGYGKVRKVTDSVYAGANGALMLCKEMPEEYWAELNQPA